MKNEKFQYTVSSSDKAKGNDADGHIRIAYYTETWKSFTLPAHKKKSDTKLTASVLKFFFFFF